MLAVELLMCSLFSDITCISHDQFNGLYRLEWSEIRSLSLYIYMRTFFLCARVGGWGDILTLDPMTSKVPSYDRTKVGYFECLICVFHMISPKVGKSLMNVKKVSANFQLMGSAGCERVNVKIGSPKWSP